MPGTEIKQGDSLGLAYGISDDVNLNSWSCKIAVKTSLDQSTPTFTLNLTQRNQDSTRFVGVISRDTTKDWPPGEYLLLADVWNPGTGEGKEFQADLRIMAQGII